MKQSSNNVFKWFMHIIVMLGDVMVICVAIMALISAYKIGSMVVWIIIIALMFACYKAFMDTGGFMAWTNRGRKEFEDGFDAIKNNDNQANDV